MTRRKKDTVNPDLIWDEPADSWPPAVKRLYQNAKKNPHREFWEQTDVDLLWLTCQAHSMLLMNALEFNASGTKVIFDRYDALNLSVRGRVMSGLSPLKDETVTLSDGTLERMAAIIRGEINPLEATDAA